MNRQTWILLDMSYLAYRAFYAVPGLSHQDVGTSVPFGVFRDIDRFREDFNTENFCFCFDSDTSLRKNLYPAYKENRKPNTEEKLRIKKEIKSQIKRMKEKLLPAMKHGNIIHQEGYEADDMIAACVLDLQGRTNVKKIIIVSADKDLYQLLYTPKKLRFGETVIFNPRNNTTYNEAAFREEYKLSPLKWHIVKAVAGCNSDNIPGVPRIGDATAAQILHSVYVESKPPSGKKALAVVDWIQNPQYALNLKLTKLPMIGMKTDLISPKPCPFSYKDIDAVKESLGIQQRRRAPLHKGFKLEM